MITDLLHPTTLADPYAVYADLREAGPLVWLPEHHAWFLSTYEAVHAGFRDAANLSSDRLTPLERRLDERRRALLGQTFELLRGWMVFHDPPDHERLRAPLRRTFTPRMVESLRPRVESLVEELCDGMAVTVAERGSVDLIADFAFPLPAIVIAELLGVPPADRDRFKTWSAQLAAIVFGASNRPDQAEAAAAGSAQFAEYFSWLIDRYTADPADNLISALIAVTGSEDGNGLSPSELVGALTLLLFGGHETTTNFVGNAVYALLSHPDQLRWLREQPGAIAGAGEELQRYDGSTKLMVRIVARDHDRHGQSLRTGQTVFLGVASANRDPAFWGHDADTLRLDRPDAAKHVGFGYGLHFCLGAPLARLESTIAFNGLLRRFGTIELATDALEHGGTLLGRGLRTLPVRLV